MNFLANYHRGSSLPLHLRYALEKELGRGGFCVVHAALDTHASPATRVAVKTFAPEVDRLRHSFEDIAAITSKTFQMHWRCFETRQNNFKMFPSTLKTPGHAARGAGMQIGPRTPRKTRRRLVGNLVPSVLTTDSVAKVLWRCCAAGRRTAQRSASPRSSGPSATSRRPR